MPPGFNEVAGLYDSSLSPLPEAFARLLQDHFQLRADDRVLDLGCGSGFLTLALGQYSRHVTGIDSSEAMLEIARSRDAGQCNRWVCSPVETFEFQPDTYALIISFESFHLFPEPANLIRKCGLPLKLGGHFAVGWVNYEWEVPFKDTIIKTFAAYGIEWGVWNYQSVPEVAELCRGVGFSAVSVDSVDVEAHSYVKDAAQYLASIDKASSLDLEGRTALAQELESRFQRVVSSETTGGTASYWVKYCRKVAEVQ